MAVRGDSVDLPLVCRIEGLNGVAPQVEWLYSYSNANPTHVMISWGLALAPQDHSFLLPLGRYDFGEFSPHREHDTWRLITSSSPGASSYFISSVCVWPSRPRALEIETLVMIAECLRFHVSFPLVGALPLKRLASPFSELVSCGLWARDRTACQDLGRLGARGNSTDPYWQLLDPPSTRRSDGTCQKQQQARWSMNGLRLMDHEFDSGLLQMVDPRWADGF
eukprot:Gb_28916 [translate_table: standard]